MPPLGSPRGEFIAGLRACIPMIMGIVPFGMVCGAAAVAAGLSSWQACAMSWAIFAGSAQIVATQLLANGAPLAVIVATGVVINLRFLMYSASLGPHLKHLNGRWKAVIGYLMVDQAYATSIARFIEEPENSCLNWFFLGLGGAIWVCWQAATLAGILLGNLIPANWSLDFVMPLTFISMIVPLVADRAMGVAAVTGGLAVVLLVLPLKLNLIGAALIGIAGGLFCEKFFPRDRYRDE